MPLKPDLDLQFTLLASTLYRLLVRRIGHQHERSKARQIFNRFVCSTAKVCILKDPIEVRLGRRAQNPLLVGAGFAESETPIPWLGRCTLCIVIGYDRHGPATV